jgi:hypothetical protein
MIDCEGDLLDDEGSRRSAITHERTRAVNHQADLQIRRHPRIDQLLHSIRTPGSSR